MLEQKIGIFEKHCNFGLFISIFEQDGDIHQNCGFARNGDFSLRFFAQNLNFCPKFEPKFDEKSSNLNF